MLMMENQQHIATFTCSQSQDADGTEHTVISGRDVWPQLLGKDWSSESLFVTEDDDSPQDLISYIEDLANWDVLNVLVCPAVVNSEQLRSEIVRELVKPGRSLQVPWLRDSQKTLVLGTLTLEGA